MSIDDNKAMARRANALWATGEAENFDDIFTDGYQNHQEPYVAGGTSAVSLSEYKKLLAGYHAAFSNSRNEILSQVAEGDLVATRWRFTAVQTGEYQGLAATNKEASWTGVQIDRLENGKIAESWVDWDKYGLFAQLGLVN